MQTFEQMLTEWEQVSTQLKELERRELSLRMALFGAAFPTPVVGTNKRELVDGRIFKGVYSMSYYIPAEGQKMILQQYPLLNLNTPLEEYTDRPVQYSSSKFKSAPLAVQELIQAHTTVKPSKPKIEVV